MKKGIVIIMVLAIIISIFAFNRNDRLNPYSGEYTLQGNSNTTLILNDNNTFNLYTGYGKSSYSASGKYSVNDNKINLTYTINQLPFVNKITLGKVQGSIITFFDSKTNNNMVFTK